MGLVFPISNFFTNKIALANIWRSFSCSNLALWVPNFWCCFQSLTFWQFFWRISLIILFWWNFWQIFFNKTWLFYSGLTFHVYLWNNNANAIATKANSTEEPLQWLSVLIHRMRLIRSELDHFSENNSTFF